MFGRTAFRYTNDREFTRNTNSGRCMKFGEKTARPTALTGERVGPTIYKSDRPARQGRWPLAKGWELFRSERFEFVPGSGPWYKKGHMVPSSLSETDRREICPTAASGAPGPGVPAPGPGVPVAGTGVPVAGTGSPVAGTGSPVATSEVGLGGRLAGFRADSSDSLLTLSR